MGNRFEIMPGEGVGPVRFGDTAEQVEAVLGKPTSVQRTRYAGDFRWGYGNVSLEFKSVGGGPPQFLMASSVDVPMYGLSFGGMPVDAFIAAMARHGVTVSHRSYVDEGEESLSLSNEVSVDVDHGIMWGEANWGPLPGYLTDKEVRKLIPELDLMSPRCGPPTPASGGHSEKIDG